MTDRPTTAARKAIDRLRTMKPEDEWVDKFYAAVEALWQVLKGQPIPAQPDPPHRVMALLIEDVAWARQPDSEALRLLRARIDAEPFFPKGDGPSIGNAAAFRDYKRRILAALPPSDPPETE